MLSQLAESLAPDPVILGLRAREFARLDANGQVYLDYGGSALYGESQLCRHLEMLRRGVYGNPHSEHEPSRESTRLLEVARDRLLRFLDVDTSTHEVCFTANATGAIKLVAESYPFGRNRICVLTTDNHNSVNGLREYARRAEASVRYLPLGRDLRLADPAAALAFAARGRQGLFAFPGQSNFSGVRHNQGLVDAAHGLGLDVLIDIAALAPSMPFSLRTCEADFAVLSFYKLFGYPTGLGALVATHEALARLQRPWFAGGTVSYASVQLRRHRLKKGHEGFEDGTPDFLGVAAVPAGFDLLEEAGMRRLKAHVGRLTAACLSGLQALRHRSGERLVTIYGPPTLRDRGGAIAFNVLDPEGRPIPYPQVERHLREAGVAVRGGCFCNPGAAEAAFSFDPWTSARCFDAAGDGFTVERFSSCLGAGAPVGAIRISLGLANRDADVERALDALSSFSA